MADDLAPSRSPRPTPRTTPEERRAIDRARANADAEAFAALERRAEMDPWLADDPLARLGDRDMGGLQAVDYLPLAPNAALYFPSGYGKPQLDQEIDLDILYGGGLPILESIELMDPARHAAFELEREEYLIPPGTMAIGPNYFAPPIQAHEARHRGVHIIEDMLMAIPGLYSRSFRDDPFRPSIPLSRALNEALVELKDDLTDTWVQPSGDDRPMGTHESMSHTVQYLPDRGEPGRNVVSDLDFANVQRWEPILQAIAQEELARRGEPPRAVMQEPQPGNIFYREPEPEPRGGLLGIFDRLIER